MIKSPFCDRLHASKYRGTGESFRDSMNRVANALKDSDDHYHEFRDILAEQRFLPAGRVQAAMGATKAVTAINCFIMPKMKDSFVTGRDSIMDVAAASATTMRMGGGVGDDFTPLRPRGSNISKLGSKSSGPVSFMMIGDAICKVTSSAGNRRGARMASLRVDHPDIEEFIRCKQPPAAAQPIMDMLEATDPESTEWAQWNAALQAILPLTGYNISVTVTDEFMHAVEDGTDFALRWGGKEYSRIDARALWETLMRSTWDWAEPGVLFIDTINKMNNMWYCEEICTTNPCAEEPMPPHASCLLGSWNMVKYLRWVGDTMHDSSLSGWVFNYGALADDIEPCVRAMDNVTDRTIYPLPEQEDEAKSKRRMGLGLTGLANALEILGMPYGSPEFLREEALIMTLIRDQCYLASTRLAAEKGPFPLYQEAEYLEGQFIQTLPEAVRHEIEAHGIRNSHLLSIAPTGTISLCADNVSSGIEPVFAYETQRTVKMEDGDETVTIRDYAVEHHSVRGKQCADVTAAEHLAVLEVAARLVDSSVSKTCNVSPDMPWEEFKDIYFNAWKAGIKGCTTFNTGGKRMGIMKAKKSEAESCDFDPVSGRRSCE